MTSTEDDDDNKKYHLYKYLGEGEEEDTEDYITRDEKDIPFNPKKMRLNDSSTQIIKSQTKNYWIMKLRKQVEIGSRLSLKNLRNLEIAEKCRRN